jgi:hypothetical protein
MNGKGRTLKEVGAILRRTSLIVCSTGLMIMFSSSAAASKDLDVPAIPLDKYVTVSPDGHLQCEGKRVRYWGFIGNFELREIRRTDNAQPDSSAVRLQRIAKKYRTNDAYAQRIQDLGFNLVRYWTSPACFEDYSAGDGSTADIFAKSLESLDKRGIKVWMTSLGGDILGRITAGDAAVISDPATEKAWREAIGEKGRELAFNREGGWDPRIQAITAKHREKIVGWRNRYKNDLRLGDDAQIAVWEMYNEEWWFGNMINGHWQDLPKFFRDELQDKWCEFLKKSYSDDAGLAKAWGFLLPGESLNTKTIAIAPLASNTEIKNLSDASASVLAALTAKKQAFSRDNFIRQRGSDVIRFFLDMNVAFKSAQRDALRKLGRGISRVPIIFDTGENFRIQSLFINQFNDASVMDTYLWQFAEDRQQRRFPFTSGLDESPRTSMGPECWAEACRMPGKPFFAYETQTNNPSKYRAEFPFRILALAAIQDWDIVCWHKHGGAPDPDKAEPYSGAMNYSHEGAPVEGVHYWQDEVESASMKTAGRMFINSALRPVDKPTVMIFGRKSLYDPISMDYGKSFGDLKPLINSTVYRYGCYMRADISRDNDTVIGPTLYPGINQTATMRPTDQICFDSRKGNLTIDAPSAVSYTGFFAENGGPVKFRDGIVLDNVAINNPAGMPYPMSADEKYLSLGIVAEDGKPLKESKKVTISLVSTSFNSGFSLDSDNVANRRPYGGLKYGGDVPGKPAVLIARVGARISAPMLDGMNYVLRDWYFRPIERGTVKNGEVVVPADKPVFLIELTRTGLRPTRS